MREILNSKQKKTVYCHFSFRRPRGKDYGLFSVALFYDYDGTRLASQVTHRIKLWQNHQFITAIQSYEHALYAIHKWQNQLIENNIGTIMLVTDNSTLAGWIENPSKNKSYKSWMEKAVQPYKYGAMKEVTLSVGLCKVRKYEKSYKYCNEENVVDDEELLKQDSNGNTVINLASGKFKYTSILDIEANNLAKPEIIGIEN